MIQEVFEIEQPTRRLPSKIVLILIFTALLAVILLAIHHGLMQRDLSLLSHAQGKLVEKSEEFERKLQRKSITNSSLTSLNLTTAQLLRKIDELEAKVEALSLRVDTQNCGGYEYISTPRDITYEAPPAEYVHGCTWVVAARNGGPLQFRLIQDGEHQLTNNFTLRILTPLNSTVCDHTDITSTESMYTFHHQFVVVFFYGKTRLPGQGFRLFVRDLGSGVSTRHITFIKKEDSFDLRHGENGRYPHNQAFFVLGAPPQGMRINVTVSSINTDAGYDTITMFWIDPSKTGRTFCQIRSGVGVPDIVEALPDNMPFVLFFWTDADESGDGFRLNATFY